MASIRTSDLARAAGISVQQVRNYEAQGLLPRVARRPSGYRHYTPQHLAAVRVTRLLMRAYGGGRALRLLRAVHQGRLAEGLAVIDEQHAELDRLRQRLEHTLAALRSLAAVMPEDDVWRRPTRLRVGAAARLVNERVSALRFWEQLGLLQPDREPGSRYRVYDAHQLRRLRVLVLLRRAGHDFASVRAVLDELEAGQPQQAVAMIEKQREALDFRAWLCLEAAAALHAYVTEFGPPPPANPQSQITDQQ
ncbi:MAG TPA: MerR family transcriptional regulator [Anaerolineales bacterium]|nr:MerR family transcriptional regulator [Anaerolineales bacterium]